MVESDGARFQRLLDGASTKLERGRAYVAWLRRQARTLGSLQRVEPLAYWPSSRVAVFDIRLGARSSVLATAVLHPDENEKLVELRLSAPAAASFVTAEIFRRAMLRGSHVDVSTCVARHVKEQKLAFAGAGQDRVQPIASLNKLILLRGLQAAISSERISLTETLKTASPPQASGTGIIRHWPKGLPLSVHSLAALAMGETSDNAASDLLLLRIGRANVESSMREALRPDKPNPSLLPFLSHAEAFCLIWGPDEKFSADYLKASESERRAMLNEDLPQRMRASELRPSIEASRRLERLGWPMSPKQVVRVGDAILRGSQWDPSTPALGLLSIGGSERRYADGALNYLGVKSGWHPGVRSVYVLAQSRAKEWWSVCIVLRGAESALQAAALHAALDRVVLLAVCGRLR
ncbi:MAG: serine hydrolase [Planctomycetota bacterium]